MTCMDRPIIPSRRSRYVNGNDIHSPESSFSRAFDEAGVRPPRRNIFLERSKLEQLLHDELASDPSSNLDLYSRPERSSSPRTPPISIPLTENSHQSLGRTSEIPEGKMPAPYPRGRSGNQAEISSSRTSVDEKRATSLLPRLLSSSFSAVDMMPNKRRNRSDLQYERELIPPPTSEEEESDSDYWDFASTIAQHGSPPRKAKKRKVERQEDLLASVREMRIDGLHVGKWKPDEAKEMADMVGFDLWDAASTMAEHVSRSSTKKRKRNSPASKKETRIDELEIEDWIG